MVDADDVHVNRKGARAMTGEPNRRQLEPGPQLTAEFVPGSGITNVIREGDEARLAERGAAMPFPHVTPDPARDPGYKGASTAGRDRDGGRDPRSERARRREER